MTDTKTRKRREKHAAVQAFDDRNRQGRDAVARIAKAVAGLTRSQAQAAFDAVLPHLPQSLAEKAADSDDPD